MNRRVFLAAAAAPLVAAGRTVGMQLHLSCGSLGIKGSPREIVDWASRFGFDAGVSLMRAAMARVGVEPPPGPHMHYLHARPDRNRGASAAPAVLRLP